MSTKIKIIVFALITITMTFVGVLLDVYYQFNSENLPLTLDGFNDFLLKSFIVSVAVVVTIILTNYKRIKNK